MPWRLRNASPTLRKRERENARERQRLVHELGSHICSVSGIFQEGKKNIQLVIPCQWHSNISRETGSDGVVVDKPAGQGAEQE